MREGGESLTGDHHNSNKCARPLAAGAVMMHSQGASVDLCCSVWRCFAVFEWYGDAQAGRECRSVLQCVAVCCSVLQCINGVVVHT